ncbi:HEPN domain-containing protein [Planococcus sp. CAU13]|uniref:HEPN domain-containing protein n=1 Tax=Planococcus sp. CAU13 TaxID=1541197 RepID=UPI00052FDB0F|nr:HEPN domain-containing protein [Planococcus sp. CAU13]
MSNYKFIASIHNLKIKETLSKGILFKENLRISNSKSKLEDYIDEYFISIIGKLEYTSLMDLPYFYSTASIEDPEIIIKDEKGMDLLNYFILSTQSFSSLLWLVKDNSVNVINGFIDLEDEVKRNFHTNYRTTSFYNKEGKTAIVEFTREEINKVISLHKNLFVPFNLETSIKNEHTSKEAFNGNRFERVFHSIQAARSEAYLPSRIALFITVLETLLSTTSSEVSHKLKERLAWLLGSNYFERKEIFDNLGLIYSIRSAYVHGNTMPKKGNSIEKLEGLSSIIEDYTRKIVLKFLEDERIRNLYVGVGEATDRRIETWLNEIVLGGDGKI